jgi:hypothetical protein
VGDVEDARRVAHRLREERAIAEDTASWHSVAATSGEVAFVWSCLHNLAYGPRMEMPPGIDKAEIADMFEELDNQLRY